MKATKEEQDRAKTLLQDLLPEGRTVYTVVRHVSESGNTRGIMLLGVTKDGCIEDLSWAAARVLGRSLHAKGGVRCEGAGMDMTFEVVYALAQALHGLDKGRAITRINL